MSRVREKDANREPGNDKSDQRGQKGHGSPADMTARRLALRIAGKLLFVPILARLSRRRRQSDL
jgi:hypothetical protein